jgi:predicted Fe-Mo cluster-binding NifX family protein
VVICIPVDEAGQVGPHWGRAARVAVAAVADGAVSDWQEFDVGWDASHDDPAGHGAHHARIVRFLREHGVDTVVAGGMGPGMVNTLGKMGIDIYHGAAGDARAVVEQVIGLSENG